MWRDLACVDPRQPWCPGTPWPHVHLIHIPPKPSQIPQPQRRSPLGKRDLFPYKATFTALGSGPAALGPGSARRALSQSDPAPPALGCWGIGRAKNSLSGVCGWDAVLLWNLQALADPQCVVFYFSKHSAPLCVTRTGNHLLSSVSCNSCLSFQGFSLVQFIHWAVSNSLQPHGLPYARPPCPSPTLGVYPTYVHWVRDAIQQSHPLSSPSPPALNLSQQQVGSPCSPRDSQESSPTP